MLLAHPPYGFCLRWADSVGVGPADLYSWSDHLRDENPSHNAQCWFGRVSDYWCLPPFLVVCESLIIYDSCLCYYLHLKIKKPLSGLFCSSDEVGVEGILCPPQFSCGAQEWLSGAQQSALPSLLMLIDSMHAGSTPHGPDFQGKATHDCSLRASATVLISAAIFAFSDRSWAEAEKVRRGNWCICLGLKWQWMSLAKGNLHLFRVGFTWRAWGTNVKASPFRMRTAQITYGRHLRSRQPFRRDMKMSPSWVSQQNDSPGLWT